jgi:hypothetical protein
MHVKAKAVAGQAIREFWAPFILAAAWAWLDYRFISEDRDVMAKMLKAIAAFSAAFFLFSFMWGQWNRIKKQKQTEASLERLDAKANSLLNDFATRTENLIGHITGGESYPLLLPWIDPEEVAFSIRVEGEYPLNSLVIEVTDIDALPPQLRIGEPPPKQQTEFVGALAPGAVLPQMFPFPLYGDLRRFQVRSNALNGTVYQRFRFQRRSDHWAYATRIWKNNQVVSSQGDATILLLDPNGNPDWDRL